MTGTQVEITAAEVVEDTLDDMGLPCKRREGGWVVVAGRHRPCELVLSAGEQGLRVEAELCSWDSLDETAVEALAVVLRQATASLRHAQCKVDGARAVVVAELPFEQLKTQLRPAVAAVLVGSRALAREAVAVLSADLATYVVRFFAAGDERFVATERI